MSPRRSAFAALSFSLLACSSGNNTPGPDAGTGGTMGTGGDGGSDPGLPSWKPGDVRPSMSTAGPRGLLDVRGLVHAHSVYSHDACDGKPRDPTTDAINQPCLDDFRKALCHVGHDFVMLTDHNESFGRSEYPDTLLYLAERGDQLVTRDGAPVANRLSCDDGRTPLVLAGTESATMPVGLEGHIPGTVDERQAVYGDASAAAIEQFKAQGAVSLMQHTEDWSVDQLSTLPIDGFEMYNLHRNLVANVGAALPLLTKVNTAPEDLPQSDLIFLPIFQEDPVYLSTWAAVLAGGAKRVTTMGTDCHQNTFQALLPDGERVDSYRRMMQWFSNHLLVKPDAEGHYDDRALKDTLRAGRLYGAFEVMGYPLGFDWHASEAGTVREMGEEVSLAKGVELQVTRPSVDRLDPKAEEPLIKVRILRAGNDGWSVVAENQSFLAFTPTMPGVYRAEVRLTPRHLRGYLSTYSDLADQEFPWIYGNPIYVVD
jgi:hypothetical protein